MSRLHELFHHPDKPEISLRDLAEFLLYSHEEIMTKLQDLQAAVAAEQTVEQSAITLLQGLAQQLQAALDNDDDDAIQAVIDQVNNNASTLAAAVTANTPAPGPSAPAPSPIPVGGNTPAPAPAPAPVDNGNPPVSGMTSST